MRQTDVLAVAARDYNPISCMICMPLPNPDHSPVIPFSDAPMGKALVPLNNVDPSQHAMKAMSVQRLTIRDRIGPCETVNRIIRMVVPYSRGTLEIIANMPLPQSPWRAVIRDTAYRINHPSRQQPSLQDWRC